MYVDRVNWLVMECCVVENASTGVGICGKAVKIVGGASGARGLISEIDGGNDSSDPIDVTKPKKQTQLY